MLRDGLQDWLAGRDTDDADAAGSILAEMVIRHLDWLEAQFKKG